MTSRLRNSSTQWSELLSVCVLPIMTANISFLTSRVRMSVKWFEESVLSIITNVRSVWPALFPVFVPLDYVLSWAGAD